MSQRIRAGIVVTGTEVLTGRVADANGPWLAEQLLGLGVDVGRTVVVGDRPEDLAAALGFLQDHDLVITTGGLGPTADDLTLEIVAEVQGRAMAPREELIEEITRIIETLTARRGWAIPSEQITRSARKQGTLPQGATALSPVGTAPGCVVTSAGGGPPVVVLPGPPGELRPMWADALAAPAVVSVLAGAGSLTERTIRIWGPPESELAAVLRTHAEQQGDPADAGIEVTTCLREGELEVVLRFPDQARDSVKGLAAALHQHFGELVFSDDAGSIDDVVARMLLARGETLSTAESCTAGMLASRIADRPGSSAYLIGGFVTYANRAKVAELGVPEELLATVGAVSPEVAAAMAIGARDRLTTTYALAVTGVAGPEGGTPEKPVGLVYLALAGPAGVIGQRLDLGGSRSAIRRRTTAGCLHLLREHLAQA